MLRILMFLNFLYIDIVARVIYNKNTIIFDIGGKMKTIIKISILTLCFIFSTAFAVNKFSFVKYLHCRRSYQGVRQR